MPPGRRDLERALGRLLPDDVAEVTDVARRHARHRPLGRDELAGAQLAYQLRQRGRRGEREPADSGGLRDVGRWNHQGARRLTPRYVPRDRQRAAHRPYRRVQPELTHHDDVCHRRGRQLPGRDKDSDRDGQIERRPFLAPISRRQIDRYPLVRHIEARVDERRGHALAALLHSTHGEPHDRPHRQPLRGIHLDGHAVRVNPLHRRRLHRSKHHVTVARPSSAARTDACAGSANQCSTRPLLPGTALRGQRDNP